MRLPLRLAAALLAIVGASDALAAGPADVVAAFADARRSTVEGYGGVPLAVFEKGDASRPAIVFVHGYRQSSLAWFTQFGGRLSSRCHLVAYDLRGHGDSGAPWRADAYDNAAAWGEDLARVMAATGAANATRKPLVVAWSFGGLVTMDYLRVHGGSRLSGLVLVATTGRLFAPDGPAPVVPSRSEDLAGRAAAVRASADLVFGTGVAPELRAFIATASARTSPFVDLPTIARGAKLDNADLLPLLRTMQVTLVDGTDDAVVPRALWARTTALFDPAHVFEFERAGHAPFIERAERFDAILEDLQCRD